MDHDWQTVGRSLRAPQRLQIVGAGDGVRHASLDADDDVAIARNCAAREVHVCTCEVVEFAAGSHAGSRDVNQLLADLRRAARDSVDFMHFVFAARTGNDPTRYALLQTLPRVLLSAAI